MHTFPCGTPLLGGAMRCTVSGRVSDLEDWVPRSDLRCIEIRWYQISLVARALQWYLIRVTARIPLLWWRLTPRFDLLRAPVCGSHLREVAVLALLLQMNGILPFKICKKVKSRGTGYERWLLRCVGARRADRLAVQEGDGRLHRHLLLHWRYCGVLTASALKFGVTGTWMKGLHPRP